MKLKCSKMKEDDEATTEDIEENTEDTEILSNMSVEYEPLGVNRRRNPNVSAEILGGFQTKESTSGTRFAICTLDGTILLGTDPLMDNLCQYDCTTKLLQTLYQ